MPFASHRLDSSSGHAPSPIQMPAMAPPVQLFPTAMPPDARRYTMPAVRLPRHWLLSSVGVAASPTQIPADPLSEQSLARARPVARSR